MTRKANELHAGDRVAYTAKFVRNTGGGHFFGQQRGTVAEVDHDQAWVHWDDEEITLAEVFSDDPEYCDNVRDRGSLVAVCNICRIGTVRFGDASAS